MQRRISHVLDLNSNGIWCKLRNLDLLPLQREEIHGVALHTLNSHFTNARVNEECFNVISKASEDGIWFSPVNFNDVFLVVAHFSTQARGNYITASFSF